MADPQIHQVSDPTTGRIWLIVADADEHPEAKWILWMAAHAEPIPAEPQWYTFQGQVIW